ncbi:phage virion morphogenesis protein [Aeromonas hydrophila]|uniref:phage virion morphogenesis protein n=1 Tax=Aeromonas hydrophila TaxID=644 RepID=UPI003F7947F3
MGCAGDPGRRSLGPALGQVPRPQAAPCRRGAAPERRSARHPQLSGRSPGPLFGTPLEYGAAHQFGRPEINLPERPYLGLSETDQQSVLETLEGYLTADAP